MRIKFAQVLKKLSENLEEAYADHIVRFDAFAAFLENDLPKECENALKGIKSDNGCLAGKSYLNSLMISPTQRLARYPLLLKEVLKSSNAVFPDFEHLEAAFKVKNQFFCSLF
jgi:hypothetical protein